MHVDRATARVANRQKGLITTEQLLACGLGRGAIAHRVAAGQLHRVHRGVYVVGHTVMAPWAVELAAVLACGQGALLSHRSAAVLHQLLPPVSAAVDVTATGRSERRHAGIRVHRVRIERRDRARRQGIPVTAVARTVLDLAETATLDDTERAFDEAINRRLTTHDHLAALLARSPGRRGAKTINALLDRDHVPGLTRREAERLLLKLIRAARLPLPRVNARIGKYTVDFYWPEHGLVLEMDSHAWHTSPQKFETDRLRDQILDGQQIRVIRSTWLQVTQEPYALVARLARSLAMPSAAA
jgi:very-short-patch-repair endonuclease